MDFRWAVWGEVATGSLPCRAQDVRELKGHGIEAVLSLQRPSPQICEEIKNAGMQHVISELEDFSTPSFEQMNELRTILQSWSDAGKAVYVHCYAGIGRCRTVAAAFLAFEAGSAEDALELVGEPENNAQAQFVRDYWAQRP